MLQTNNHDSISWVLFLTPNQSTEDTQLQYDQPVNTNNLIHYTITTTTTVLQHFFRDHLGEPVPEKNFWTLWCKERLTRGRHTDNPAGRHSIRTNHCPHPPSPIFFTDRMPFLPPNQQCQSTEGKTKFTATLNNHAIGTQKYYNSK